MVLVAPAVADAQEDTKIPFYEADRDSSKDKGTAFSGSITSSSFFFTESAENDGAAIPIENASATDRVFTDLRLQLKADHISGGKLDFKFDFRARQQIERCEPRLAGAAVIDTCEAAQAGSLGLGGEELHLRQAHLTYRGRNFDIGLGRQIMPEVGAVKFDGVRVEQHKGKDIKYVGFAGLYPTRGARDLRADYPSIPSDVTDPASAPTRLLPVVAGAGASYRKERVYGAVGVAGILPRGDELLPETGSGMALAERPRIFLTSNGYWQQSEKTDIYHYLVVDVAGSRGAAITNISLGASHRPTAATRLFARVNRVDTETLNVHAQQRLDLVDPMASAPIQNNWYISRVAQESGELGGTATFSANRFALTASGTMRRRPELALLQTDNAEVVLPTAQALDIQLQLVDRRSFKDFRIGASVTRSAGLGDENLDRSKSTMGNLELSRDLADGKGEFELNLSYLQSADQSLEFNCPPVPGPVDFLECFGSSEATALGGGGVVFYRPKKNWFAMGMANISRLSLATADVAGAQTAQPPVLMITAFLRLAYRF